MCLAYILFPVQQPPQNIIICCLMELQMNMQISFPYIYQSNLIYGKALWGEMKCKFVNSTRFIIKAYFVVNHVNMDGEPSK